MHLRVVHERPPSRSPFLTRVLRSIAVAGVLAVLASGCRTSDLTFRADKRVHIVSPKENSEVKLPVHLEWNVADFRVTGPDGSASGDRGYFAVFMDTSPIPPGTTLDYVARGDDSCKRSEHCPDAGYLLQRGVITAASTNVSLDSMPDNRPVDRPSAKDHHIVTIVLLNGQSRRIGESSFRVEFDLDRGEG